MFAAASLTDVFTELGDQLEKANPGLRRPVQLRRQLGAGHPDHPGRARRRLRLGQRGADGGRHRRRAAGASDPAVFTENVLEIAVPKGNPGARHRAWPTSPSPTLTLAVCAPDVPCGAAAAEGLRRPPGSTPKPDTEEEDVKAALTKVQLGEVDAALVYATDVQAAGDRSRASRSREAEQAINKYPICALKAAPNPRRPHGVRRPGPLRRRARQALTARRLPQPP